MKTAVLALGGNALARAGEPPTVTNQFRHARESMAPIVELAREGWRIAIVHGNGPQVGDELVRNEAARRLVEPLPLGVLVAETAGWIGYMLQQSLQNALAAARVEREVVTVITQTLVDRYDPALSRPTKPIGHALSDADAARLRDAGRAVGRDGAGDWRRMATSPLPLGIVEFPVVQRLLDQNTIVIAAGGGGPPVYHDPLLGLEGVDAVVDKDRVSAILATQLGAEVLMILTNVAAVYEGWGTPAARPIRRMSAARAEELITLGSFDAGGMKPKVEAALGFVRSSGAKAIIAQLSDGPAALKGQTGTTITREQ
ncbi:MAG: carbamate kinase [Gemmatimonadales bacterium]|nr:carbamate kinase [Gemmatimonadales bacterium]MDQ3426466.1 carbamate kinase [Gemmatimonadota bacterium]